MIPMCSFASNVIGSHRAPPDATLFKKKSKNIFRTLFFRTRSQKGTFKAFPTKWYTFSLFQSVLSSHSILLENAPLITFLTFSPPQALKEARSSSCGGGREKEGC